ncbi:MAG: 3'-5' exonuclease [Xanthomonadales bacterium]|nr:3'-5' exonuclease [Gammaproteobacteria bacterium]MBT8051981.1 3'-5' exonuclease [Gammaproteobacteria bacterium]MBT8057586.1 3'-5' exonuclease [Gammaproteobacteria bacterium]NNJ78341.1 3'-5' exonuclease [Xanthomonadales bacterium]NNL03967.1 3'-5' exonuclease [Xanthomonadales bacterium]
MLRRWRYRRKCGALAARAEPGVLQRYLQAGGDMRPGDIQETPMIAADLELTGLNAAADQIISVGWTLIDDGRVRLGTNRHVLVTASRTVGSSAAIHELMDNEVAGGVEPGEALSQLFEAAAGRVWVFHHAALDVAFLQRACREWAGMAPPFAVLDTMQIELGWRKRRDQPVKQGDLQLSKLRSDYHLPRYTAHNALVDALATAELLLAIAARLDRKKPLDIAPYLRYA